LALEAVCWYPSSPLYVSGTLKQPQHPTGFFNITFTSLYLLGSYVTRTKEKHIFIMAPIRVGFLGLSKGGWARGAHLPYLEKSENYQIVAICNSSVESSRDAIKLYNLPEGTRAYGDPEGRV
jgi:hypothetical protein